MAAKRYHTPQLILPAGPKVFQRPPPWIELRRFHCCYFCVRQCMLPSCHAPSTYSPPTPHLVQASGSADEWREGWGSRTEERKKDSCDALECQGALEFELPSDSVPFGENGWAFVPCWDKNQAFVFLPQSPQRRQGRAPLRPIRSGQLWPLSADLTPRGWAGTFPAPSPEAGIPPAHLFVFSSQSFLPSNMPFPH